MQNKLLMSVAVAVMVLFAPAAMAAPAVDYFSGPAVSVIATYGDSSSYSKSFENYAGGSYSYSDKQALTGYAGGFGLQYLANTGHVPGGTTYVGAAIDYQLGSIGRTDKYGTESDNLKLTSFGTARAIVGYAPDFLDGRLLISYSGGIGFGNVSEVYKDVGYFERNNREGVGLVHGPALAYAITDNASVGAGVLFTNLSASTDKYVAPTYTGHSSSGFKGTLFEVSVTYRL